MKADNDLDTRDLGMAEGQGGILAVLFTSPPRWDAPNLGVERQTALWHRAVWTGAFALVAMLVVLVAAILVP